MLKIYKMYIHIHNIPIYFFIIQEVRPKSNHIRFGLGRLYGLIFTISIFETILDLFVQ